MAYTVSQTLYYCKASGKAYTAHAARYAIGFDPSTVDATVLPSRGVYTVNQAEPTFDERLYDVGAAIYTINGNYADQTWTQTAKSLADAKTAGKTAVKDAANTAAGTGDGFYALMLIAAASKLSADRSTEAQAALTNITTILDDLVTDIQAIEAAADVAAIDAIVNP